MALSLIYEDAKSGVKLPEGYLRVEQFTVRHETSGDFTAFCDVAIYADAKAREGQKEAVARKSFSWPSSDSPLSLTDVYQHLKSDHFPGAKTC
jgi:hypothetical protein